MVTTTSMLATTLSYCEGVSSAVDSYASDPVLVDTVEELVRATMLLVVLASVAGLCGAEVDRALQLILTVLVFGSLASKKTATFLRKGQPSLEVSLLVAVWTALTQLPSGLWTIRSTSRIQYFL